MKLLVDRPELSRPLTELTITHLSDADPFVRRAAAEVLGAHASIANVKALLSLRQSTSSDDTHLIHVARIALRDQLKNPEIWSRLDNLGLTEGDRRDIADVATGVPDSKSAAFLLAQLRRHQEDHSTLLRYAHHIARYGEPTSVAATVGLATDEKRTPVERLDLLKSIQEGAQERGAGLDDKAKKLASRLTQRLLGSSQSGEITMGIDVARDFQFRDLDPEIKNLVARHDLPEAPRMHAMEALTVIDPKANLAILGNVLADAAAPMVMRERAATLLGNLDLIEAKTALLSNLASAPERLQSAIAQALVRRREGADALLQAIAAGKASARLLQQRPVTIRLESSGLPQVAERITALLKGLPPADEKLSALYASRRGGFQTADADPVLGVKVFEKHCGICHQMGGTGAKVGPQLDGIGSRGLDRLMEDVLDPNRNVDQSFRVTTLALQNGQVVGGLLLREEGEVLIVADSQGKEVRVPKSLVEDRSISPMSPMPANLTDQISANDFYHLMAYLLSRREPTEIPPAGVGSKQ
jgi:putative heme-binding domain-containing protein